MICIYLGLPIYRGGFPARNCLDNLLNPRASLPPSAVTRDPFWYDLGDLEGLRPLRASSYLPPSLRDSYLSPVSFTSNYSITFYWQRTQFHFRKSFDLCVLNLKWIHFSRSNGDTCGQNTQFVHLVSIPIWINSKYLLLCRYSSRNIFENNRIFL